MPAQLVALSDGTSILLDKPILLLGRDPECDILIESRKISRRHCCIAQVSNYLIIRDLGSTNGIRINGERVQEGQLKHGDEVMIGNQSFRVSWDSIAPGRDKLRPAGFAAAPGPALGPGSHRKVTEIDDALLEACDEPVPLADPEHPPPPSLPSRILTDNERGALLPEPPVETDKPSRVLPEQRDLLAAGDSLHPASNPPPQS